MKTIYDLLEVLSNRTAMYTGEHKLSNIKSFIDGYSFALKDENESEKFISNFRGFHDWVAERYGFNESTAGWQNMILAVEMGLSPQNINWLGYSENANVAHHEASIATFFELVQEYKNA